MAKSGDETQNVRESNGVSTLSIANIFLGLIGLRTNSPQAEIAKSDMTVVAAREFATKHPDLLEALKQERQNILRSMKGEHELYKPEPQGFAAKELTRQEHQGASKDITH